MSLPDCGFFFVFDSQDKVVASYKKVEDIVRKEYGEDPVTYLYGKYGKHFSIPVPGTFMPFEVNTYQCEQGLWGLSITNVSSFFPYNDTQNTIDFYNKFFTFFQRCCTELQPLAGFFDHEENIYGNSYYVVTMSKFEYYCDPYFFAVDPDKINSLNKLEGSSKYKNPSAFNYITEESIKKELEEIKKILPIKTLEEIIFKHTYKNFTTIGGSLGCYKYEGFQKQPLAYIYPRYFVREEIRSRGLKLNLSKADVEYYYFNRKKYTEKVFEVFKQIINEGKKHIIDEALSAPLFDVNFEKACKTYQFAYRKASDTTKKDAIVQRFFNALSSQTTTKEDVTKHFPLYSEYNELYPSGSSFTPEREEKENKARKELRNYLEKE